MVLQVHIPPSAMLDGVHAQNFYGTGVIVHHSPNLGLVAVDRNTVPISVSDVMLSFAAYPVEIPAEVCLPKYAGQLVSFTGHDLLC
mgnify:CR=1 FL=1